MEGVSIGHPIGVSGCRIIMTLIAELRRRGKRYGLVVYVMVAVVQAQWL